MALGLCFVYHTVYPACGTSPHKREGGGSVSPFDLINEGGQPVGGLFEGGELSILIVHLSLAIRARFSRVSGDST